MLYEIALIPSAELDCLLATDGSYPPGSDLRAAFLSS